MQALNVELGSRSYPIVIDGNLLAQPDVFNSYLGSGKVVIVTNDVVAPLYLQTLLNTLGSRDVHTIVLPDGEIHKTLTTFEKVIGQLLTLEAARDTTLIALGGGVIGDLTGFVAASFQRGMPFIQVPTTLLAQVDSSVGGKTAVNHALGKNMIGAFYQPKAVVIDVGSLSSLPEREFSAGMAEVVKYGVIHDAAFFTWLEENAQALWARDSELLTQCIAKCCQVKADIVALDERESGIRALLNLGHTFGHAIEAHQGYGNWLHGEAVSTGIVLASTLSNAMGWMQVSELRRIEELLKQFKLPIDSPSDMDCDTYLNYMRHDKKVKSGKIRFIIPKSIGAAVVTDEVSEAQLRSLLDE